MSGRHSDPVAFDGCRNRTADGLMCGHSYAAHDLANGGCSLCAGQCPSYWGGLRPAFLVLGALVLVVGALVLIHFGVLS